MCTQDSLSQLSVSGGLSAAASVSLFVYESVDLELGLYPGGGLEGGDGGSTAPPLGTLVLVPDSTVCNRWDTLCSTALLQTSAKKSGQIRPHLGQVG